MTTQFLRIFFTAFISFALIANPAWAHRTTTELDIIRAHEIYQATQQLCEAPSAFFPNDRVFFSDQFYEMLQKSGEEVFWAFNPFADLSTLITLYSDNWVSRAYKNLLDSPYYQQALQDCFPNDASQQQSFSQALVKADAVGRSLGLVAAGGTWAFFIWTWSRMQRAFPRTMKWTNAGLMAWGGLAAMDLARRIYIGPTAAERQEMMTLLRDRIHSSASEVEKQNLQLVDEIIRDMREQLRQSDRTSPRYRDLWSRLQILKKKRREMADYILHPEKYDQEAAARRAQTTSR